MPGFLELGGFAWIYVDLHGFRWISWIPGTEVLRPVAALRGGLWPLKKDGRLQSCRFGGLDAWMPGGLEVRGLAACLACLLADGIGLDWI